GARTCSEVTNRQLADGGVPACPVRRGNDAAAKQRNIESVLGRTNIDALFSRRKQVEEERRDMPVVERLGHLTVAAAEAAAATAMREDHESSRVLGKVKVSVEHIGAICYP